MNDQTPTAIAPVEAPPALREKRRLWENLWRGVVFFWKYVVGVVFCQGLLTSVLVVGWTYRLMQRSVLKQWWKQSDLSSQELTFEIFLAGSSQTQDHVQWPNWVVGRNWKSSLRGRAEHGFLNHVGAFCKGLSQSFWLNLKQGGQGIFNTWVLTLPGCVLWLFAWYDGWNNSFSKGYEQAAIGPLTGVLGVILFILAMFYVPMAQARQAATGQWRSFYDFKVIGTLIRHRWLACFGLAVLFSLLSIPVTILKTMPAFFPQMNQGRLDLITDAEALRLLKTYFFWAGFVVFPGYVFLRLKAARIYAGSVVSALQSGVLGEDALAEVEWQALHRLGLLRVHPAPARHAFVRAAAWVGTRAGRVTIALATFFVWFTFVAQIFTSEFLNYHPVIGWLNQALVQLPWFQYIPPHLK